MSPENLIIPEVGKIEETEEQIEVDGNGSKYRETLEVAEEPQAVEAEGEMLDESVETISDDPFASIEDFLMEVDQELVREDLMKEKIARRQQLLKQLKKLDTEYQNRTTERKQQIQKQNRALADELEAKNYTEADYRMLVEIGIITDKQSEILNHLASTLKVARSKENLTIISEIEARQKRLHDHMNQKISEKLQAKALAKQTEVDQRINELETTLEKIVVEIDQISGNQEVVDRMRSLAEEEMQKFAQENQNRQENLRQLLQSIRGRVDNTLKVIASAVETDIETVRAELLASRDQKDLLNSLRKRLINGIKAGQVFDYGKLKPWKQAQIDRYGVDQSYEAKMNELRNEDFKNGLDYLLENKFGGKFGEITAEQVNQMIETKKVLIDLYDALKALMTDTVDNAIYDAKQAAKKVEKIRPEEAVVEGETVDPLISGKDIPVEVYEIRGPNGQYRRYLDKGTVTLEIVKAKNDSHLMVRVVDSTGAAKENLPQGKLETAIDPNTDFSQAPDWLKPIVRQFYEVQQNKAE